MPSLRHAPVYVGVSLLALEGHAALDQFSKNVAQGLGTLQAGRSREVGLRPRRTLEECGHHSDEALRGGSLAHETILTDGLIVCAKCARPRPWRRAWRIASAVRYAFSTAPRHM